MTTETSPADEALEYAPPHKASSLEGMPLAWIEPSPLNPRRRFDEESLAELAESIREHGLMEPLVVRQVSERPDGSWRCIIIAGERRWRAAKLAGLTEVPVRLIEGIDERKHVELALLENLQRQDLDPLEEAAGYKALSELGYTQTQIASAVKRSQPVVARTMGLLALPEDVQERIRAGELTPSHGTIIAARYREYPALASAIAAIAVEQRMTTQRLEQSIPDTYSLSRAGLLVEVDSYGTKFDRTICLSCPFGAYRREGSYSGYCLKPEHFQQLQEDAIALKGARVAALVEKVKASGKGFPKISDFNYDAYERIEASRTPASCTGDCPCRLPVQDHGGKVVEICTDPKRYRALTIAATKERNKDARAVYKERLKEMHAALEGITEVGPRELAIVVAAALNSTQPVMAREAAQEWAPTVAGLQLTTWDFRDKHFAELAKLHPLVLVRLALDALVRNQLRAAMEVPTSGTAWYDWLVGEPSGGGDSRA